jgi:hypothetical protein
MGPCPGVGVGTPAGNLDQGISSLTFSTLVRCHPRALEGGDSLDHTSLFTRHSHVKFTNFRHLGQVLASKGWIVFKVPPQMPR